MTKHYLIILISLWVFPVTGQGLTINDSTTPATAEVDGNLRVNGDFYLENPGEVTNLDNAKLLVQSTSNDIMKYDIDVSKYGPINYSQYIFQNVNSAGLMSYDTKIPVSKYVVTVQGFYFTQANYDENILLRSTVANDRIEGYTVRAYVDTASGASFPTWHFQAFGTDSTFRTPAGAVTNANIFLNVFIFRRGFVIKDQGDVTVDMNNNEINNAATLPGFFVIYN
ncbi:hypothetical protein [Nonlabens xiamenensis]|uniref:hypothetical protein n=1 Tax=Nonlabens xiamenensis TaxID=2341043 RepID=UPI000F60A9C4|nr:hypothetical protein [Nonlabens xiamenensis]